MVVTLASLQVVRLRAARAGGVHEEYEHAWGASVLDQLIDPDNPEIGDHGPGRPIFAHLATSGPDAWADIDISAVLTGTADMSANDVVDLLKTSLILEPVYDFGVTQLNMMLGSLGSTSGLPVRSPAAEIDVLSFDDAERAGNSADASHEQSE